MADSDRHEDESIDLDEATELLSKYVEARRTLPWDQWTTREKVSYYLDRCFLAFLVIFLLVFFGEVAYKMWYLTNINKVGEFVKDLVGDVFKWLFTQDGQEQLAEL